MRLADVTARAEHLIEVYAPAVKAFLDRLTAEDPHVGALFDRADDQAMRVYRELGLPGDDGKGEGVIAIDVLERGLVPVYARLGYVPIDELPGYLPGTVPLYVFTMGEVVLRRFEPFVQPIAKLREIQRTRDIELAWKGLGMKGEPALELLVQMAEPTLRRLWKGERDEMLLIQRAPHGAKVGTISRDYAVERLRWGAGQSGVDERQRGKLRSLADSLVAGPPHDCVQCLVQGWGVDLVIPLRFLSLPAGHRTGFKDDDARVLHEYIVACRDQRRALGALEKCLDKLSSTSMASLLAELVALARHHWDDCDAILAKLEDVARAGRELSNTPAGARLVLVRMAMYQATMDRKQGGAVNAAGGSA